MSAEELEREIDRLRTAIRDHRATRTPAYWSPADRALYQHLPEVEMLHVPNPPLRRRHEDPATSLPVPPCQGCGAKIENGDLYQVIECPSSGGARIRARPGIVRCESCAVYAVDQAVTG